MNKRRKPIAALVSPLSSLAQPAPKVWRVGFLVQRSRPIETPPRSC
jgi:hypothetical protein